MPHPRIGISRASAAFGALLLVAVFVGWWAYGTLLGPGDSARPASAPDSAAATSAPPAATAPASDAPVGAAGADPIAAAYDLAADEKRGGHTLARHVGKSDAELIERLKRERGISAASTYADRVTAERIVAATLTQQRSRVDAWLNRQGNRPNLALNYRGRAADPIGRSVRRGATRAMPCVDAVVVLRWDRARSFYVLTSYPEARR
jgi:hypothetical protein